MEQSASFWNFKEKKVYSKTSEKWGDFLFGFLISFLFMFGSVMIGAWFALIGVIVAVYFFSRRRFIFFGMIASVVVLPPLVPLLYFAGII